MCDRLLIPCLALLAAGLAAGCETGFEPFQESELHYSIAGYLDAGADTQFVRVAPIRTTLAAGAPLDAVVTTEHVATGARTVWQDSVFIVAGVPVHNVWTAEPFEPGEAYRFTVRGSDGATSSAVVRLPEDFPDPLIIPRPIFARFDTINVFGIARVADLVLEFDVVMAGGEARTFAFSHLDELSPLGDDFTLIFTIDEDIARIRLENGGVPPALRAIRVVVAAAGPDWPNLEGVDIETIALPDVISNIEGGTGYLGGITSKTLPWP